ncbi:serine/threonine protein kinase [Phytophthora nicotianae INRA-310]|uniref:Serine/threonine protein kinase n=1 Tax=Phytophthora nicotianae (strain INRA-310) TaxID=761204 RepID=W2QA33_PHYN3|nr:serine/threonine protein kinase [Phytophthora nicotianae INRA-310]ETN09721.1 serine/threonine protein kinase [Phytophthora nicotianae INRA-310]
MKRTHDEDQVELAGALTSLRSESAHGDAVSATTSASTSFTGPSIEKRHASWTAWAKYLDDYCNSNGVRIGIEFTDSIQKRNIEMRNSKRAKDGKFVRFLPQGLDAYRRSYVCHLGRKGRTRDIKFRRTACPFKLVAKSVYNDSKWEVEVTCPNPRHIHSEATGEPAAPACVEAEAPPKPSIQSIPIEGLKGSPCSRRVLTDMAPRCKRMPENEVMCTRLLQRLNNLHDSVASLDDKDARKQIYIDVIIRFVKLMHRKQLLLRLASSATVVYKVHELHDKLNDVARELELSHETRRDQLKDDQDEQYAKLKELITAASDRMLINEFRGDHKLHEALMTLTHGLKWKSQSSEMLHLKRATLARVTKILPELTRVDWFIPRDELEYEEKIIGAGTFGEARLGAWLHYGNTKAVVVKQLFKEIDSYSGDTFFKQLEIWNKLEDNHILKLYGGSHINRPQLYVCEYATGGNLRGFFGKKENRTRFWRMFQQAAQGLQVLHLARIPHGALKCSNILVGDGDTVKLTDFGFRSVRSLSAALSGDAEDATANAIRWKPKEVLEENFNEELLYVADIYAIGMCMIEALTQQDPFPKVDNNVVVEVIRKGETYKRPDGILDAEWDFISRLCNSDYSLRPKSINEVLKEISLFVEGEQGREDPAKSITGHTRQQLVERPPLYEQHGRTKHNVSVDVAIHDGVQMEDDVTEIDTSATSTTSCAIGI